MRLSRQTVGCSQIGRLAGQEYQQFWPEHYTSLYHCM